MTHEPTCGKTAVAPVSVLPELAIDLSEEGTVPVQLGKTAVPVQALPELAIDFESTLPALHLELSLRSGVPGWQVSLDLFRLYAKLNQLELSLHGSGLLPAKATSASGERVSVTFMPANPIGAAERLARIVSAINDLEDCPAVLRCEAKIVSVAA
jgi:hypothetical protein